MSNIQGSRYFKYCRILDRNYSDTQGDTERLEGLENYSDGEEVANNDKYNRAIASGTVQPELIGIPAVDWISGACRWDIDGVLQRDCKQCLSVSVDAGCVPGLRTTFERGGRES